MYKILPVVLALFKILPLVIYLFHLQFSSVKFFFFTKHAYGILLHSAQQQQKNRPYERHFVGCAGEKNRSGVDYFYIRELIKNMSLTTLAQLSLSPLRFEIHMSFRLSILLPSLQIATAGTLTRIRLAICAGYSTMFELICP